MHSRSEARNGKGSIPLHPGVCDHSREGILNLSGFRAARTR